jgi:AcrR family transcriptional regulator
MKPRPKSPVASRKQPRQERSKQLVADILEASIRVLQREGGQRFNTIRVAEEAGVSVGSLYQYFPNKAALLWRLQLDEWDSTFALLARHLEDRSRPPSDRWRTMILEFLRTELAEAALRHALNEASASFRHTPEMRAQETKARSHVSAFLEEALPGQRELAFTTDFFFVTLGSIAERVTERKLSSRELTRWATALADMMCGYLERLCDDAA